jgi:hypothetical protein
MICSICEGLGYNCPCCCEERESDYEPETMRCIYCCKYILVEDIMTDAVGGHICKNCAKSIEEELSHRFSFNPEELINCLTPAL